jgi:peptide/nickel transport system permease protein
MSILRRTSLGGLIAAFVLCLYAVAGVLGPVLAPFTEAQIVGTLWQQPDGVHLLGTDGSGRDMLSRLLYGAQTTLFLSLVITVLAALIGTALGLLAAIMGGALDALLSRSVDVLLSLPSLVVALLVVSVMGSSPVVLVILVAVIEAVRIFRLARALSADVMAMDFTEVSRLRGESVLWIMRRDILPNIWPQLLLEYVLRFGFSISMISSLSFLGLGIQPPHADWGSMVKENASAISFGVMAPLYPAAAIAGIVVALNIFIDSISPGAAASSRNEK